MNDFFVTLRRVKMPDPIKKIATFFQGNLPPVYVFTKDSPDFITSIESLCQEYFYGWFIG